MSNIIVGLDIGTCNIRVIIGEVDAENKIEVIGVAKRPSQGLRNGVIVNIDAAMSVIKETIEAAELVAGVEVTSVYTAIGGAQVESLNSKGQIGVDSSGKGRTLEINENAKMRAIESAKAVVIPLDKKLIHVIPQEYIIDGLAGYENPVGIMGVRLEVKVHIVTASITAYSNIEQCVQRANYFINGVIMLKTLAIASAVATKEEMDLGSIIIDLGGGTTDVMVLMNGAPVFTTSIPVGGNLVTNDIAIVKGISNSVAEKIKVESGCCWNTGSESDEEVIIPGVGGRPPEQTTRFELCEIIQPRMDEIFSMVKREVVRRAGLTKLSGSIILTGGGALMPGVVELAQSVFGTSAVRLGESPDLGGVDSSYREPDFATVVGLITENKKNVNLANTRKAKKSGADEKKASPNLWQKLKNSFF